MEWKHKKLFDENSIEELQNLSTEELENYELSRIQYNANKVCDEAVSRIDGAPGPGGYLTGYKAENKEDMFFADQELLINFLSNGEKERGKVPGAVYCKKLSSLIEQHCEIGMKYMELLKFECVRKIWRNLFIL